MNKFRITERRIGDLDEQGASILLIGDSIALSLLLKQRLEAETTAQVLTCKSYSEAEELLEDQTFTLALTDFRLPDAPTGRILELLSARQVPTILYTAAFDKALYDNYASRKLVNYIVKNQQNSVDSVIAMVSRIIANRSISVLVADDTRTARSTIVEFLTRQNFNVFEASCGNQALELLEQNPRIELVITDYHMPDMDGYELTKRIRERHGTDRLRVLGISSSSDRMLSANFLRAGASDFVYRPFVPEELQCRIDNNVETLMQLKRLRHLAERDPLTQLYNRRAFFELAEQKISRMNASGGFGSVAILDADHFKKINDTYGHDAGDMVLVRIARILLAREQSGNVLAARLGGEEFVVMMHDLDPAAAHAECESIRREIEACEIEANGNVVRVTASIGLATIEPGEALDNQLNAADQMLYMAKASGRNRTSSDMIYAEPVKAVG